ncbi:MAG: hypothetical protein IT581_13110 [Verrucomicrobiales bacterium]|nr:hypothetical protein [Verrucomicrobiales bacterium]
MNASFVRHGARGQNRSGRTGFSVIELVGVLAIMAILAVALVPALMKGYDRVARENESRALESMGNGLRGHVLRFQNIPSATNYASLLATELGWQVSDVVTNARAMRRVYLIDPWITNTLQVPYTQSAMGLTNPITPYVRVVFISSVGATLPASLVSGVASSPAVFSNIWNTAELAVPTGWTWKGNGEDLRMCRVDLDSLFVPVVLNYDTYTVNATNRGRFTVGNSTTNILPNIPSYTANFIKGSVLGLHSHSDSANTLQVREVVQHPLSFVYERDAWRGQLFLGRGLRLTSGLDLQAAHDLFISSPTNMNAQGSPMATPTLVMNALSNYMAAYLAWQTAGFPSKDATYTAVTKAQSDMESASMDLLHKP